MIGQIMSPGKERATRAGSGRRWAGLAALLLSTTALVGLAVPALAVDAIWDGSTDNNWDLQTNWDVNGVPMLTTPVFINTDQGGSFPIISAGNANASNLTIGNTAAGFLGVINGNTLTIQNDLNLGTGVGFSSLQVNNGSSNNGSTVTVGGAMFIGSATSSGIAEFAGSATLNVAGNASIGNNNTGSNGINFFTNAQGHFSGDLNVAYLNSGGTANLNVQAGADVDALSLYVGVLAGSNGTVNVEGAGSTLDVAAFFTVGAAGTGTLNINDSGVVTADSNFGVVIGDLAGSSGTINISTNGALTGASYFGVGVGGTGGLNISGGGLASAGQLLLGDTSNGLGLVTVSDATSALVLTSNFPSIVGSNGTGVLTIADGGLVDLNGGASTLTIAQNAGSSGTLNIGAAFGDVAIGAGTLNAGLVQFGAGSGTLTFNHTDMDYGFDAWIVGSGTINQIAGVTKLSGDNAGFTGMTDITGGSLYVNGFLGGTLNVNGGTLGGSGALTGALTVGNGGILAPGNSIGTLNVANITFNAGSTYTVELKDGGFVAGTNNDLINATGTATINGGTIHVTPENGTDNGTTYMPGTYTILTAAGGVTGAFNTLTDDYAFLNFALGYDANNVLLTSSLAATSFCLTGMTSNQCAAGEGTFSLGGGNSVFDAVLNLSNAEAPIALDLLSGEVHASAKTALIEDSRFAREAALDRLRIALGGVGTGAGQATNETPEGANLWMQGFGSRGNWTSNGNAAEMDRNIGGLFLGGDAEVTDDVTLGLMGGYSRSGINLADRMSSGTVDSYTLGAYAGGEWDAFSLKGGLAHSWNHLDTSRSVSFTGFADSLSASTNSRTFQAYTEAAYGIETGPARFEPFANLAYVNLSTDGFAETGGAAALTSIGDAVSATFTTLGVRAETMVALGETEATLRGMLGWQHAFGDTPAATHTFAGGDAFTVAGVPIARDALVLEAGFNVKITDTATLGLSYNGQFSSGFSDHSAKASLGIKF